MSLTVAMLVAVWAVLAATDIRIRHANRHPMIHQSPDRPLRHTSDRTPGWALRQARARRGPERIEYVRILPGPIRVKASRPALRTWTAPIPAEPVQVLLLDPDEQWTPACGGATLQLRAVSV